MPTQFTPQNTTSLSYGHTQTQPFNFNLPPSTSRIQSEPFFGDLGYSLDLPWPSVTTAGYMTGGNMNDSGGFNAYPPTNRLPNEKVLITSDQPEYFAVDNRVRATGGLPEINTKDPIYRFKRSTATLKIY